MKSTYTDTYSFKLQPDTQTLAMFKCDYCLFFGFIYVNVYHAEKADAQTSSFVFC